jgi:hypothetical protein
MGCYSSSPLKQNLVPRFLSVVVRGKRTNVRVRLQGVALPTHRRFSELPRRLAFAKGVDLLHSLKLIAEELMLPKVPCRSLVGTFLRLAGLGYLVCSKRFFES